MDAITKYFRNCSSGQLNKKLHKSGHFQLIFWIFWSGFLTSFSTNFSFRHGFRLEITYQPRIRADTWSARIWGDTPNRVHVSRTRITYHVSRISQPWLIAKGPYQRYSCKNQHTSWRIWEHQTKTKQTTNFTVCGFKRLEKTSRPRHGMDTTWFIRGIRLQTLTFE